MHYLIIFFSLFFNHLAIGMDNALENKVALLKEQLTARGFATFTEQENGIFSDAELHKLSKSLELYTREANPEDEAHKTAGTHEFAVNFVRIPEKISIEQSTQARPSVQNLVLQAAHKIIKILPSHVTSGTMNLIMFSDLEKDIIKASEIVMNSRQKQTLSFELAPLTLHQDRWQNLPYNYLYFQVLELRGFSEHYSVIGQIKEQISGSHKDENSSVAFTLQDLQEDPIMLKCARGSGYIIDQTRKPLIVHSRTKALTFVSSFFDEEKTNEYGLSHEEGLKLNMRQNVQMPCRMVLVVRIMF